MHDVHFPGLNDVKGRSNVCFTRPAPHLYALPSSPVSRVTIVCLAVDTLHNLGRWEIARRRALGHLHPSLVCTCTDLGMTAYCALVLEKNFLHLPDVYSIVLSKGAVSTRCTLRPHRIRDVTQSSRLLQGTFSTWKRSHLQPRSSMLLYAASGASATRHCRAMPYQPITISLHDLPRTSILHSEVPPSMTCSLLRSCAVNRSRLGTYMYLISPRS